MNRKIIKQGEQAYTITLPVNWIRNNNLKAGDEINFEQEENKIIISCSISKKTIRKVTINLTTQNIMRIRTAICFAYKRGYDKIILKSENKINIMKINQIVENLIGLKIDSQSENSVILKVVFSNETENIEKGINKMLYSIKYLFSEILLAAESKSYDYSVIEDYYLIILKDRDFFQRIITVNNSHDDKSYEYYNFIFLIEKISSNLEHIRRYEILNKKNIDNELNELKLVFEKFDEFIKIFLKKDVGLAIKINDFFGEYRKEIYNKNNISYPHVLLIHNIFSLTSNLVGLLL